MDELVAELELQAAMNKVKKMRDARQARDGRPSHGASRPHTAGKKAAVPSTSTKNKAFRRKTLVELPPGYNLYAAKHKGGQSK